MKVEHLHVARVYKLAAAQKLKSGIKEKSKWTDPQKMDFQWAHSNLICWICVYILWGVEGIQSCMSIFVCTKIKHLHTDKWAGLKTSALSGTQVRQL